MTEEMKPPQMISVENVKQSAAQLQNVFNLLTQANFNGGNAENVLRALSFVGALHSVTLQQIEQMEASRSVTTPSETTAE